MVRTRSYAGAALCALALTLGAGVTAASASTTSSGPPTLTGTVIDVGSNWFTLQTGGRQLGVTNALIRTATKITDEDTPYVWGGGHAEAGVASIGIKGPGYNGHTKGYDCSGSVAAVLSGAGLWPAGAGVPADNGVISELLADDLIAPGIGSGPNAVNLYDDPGVHIFMSIDGRFFGTSDGGGGGDKAGGAGWLDDGAYDASDPAFKKYHVLPSVLKEKTSYGTDYTFQLPADGLFPATAKNLSISLGDLPISDLLANEHVGVSYSSAATGMLDVTSIAVLSGGPGVTPPSTATTTTPTTPTATVTTATVPTPTATTPSVTGTPVSTDPVTTAPTTTTTSPGGYYAGPGATGGAGIGGGGTSTTGGGSIG